MKDIPNYFIENNIPKVRWMKIGRAYKALYSKAYRYDAASMYVYVINDKCVIAFRDKEFKQEIGMFKIDNFISSGEVAIKEPPKYRSIMPTALTYGILLGQEQSIEDSGEQEEEVKEVMVLKSTVRKPPKAKEDVVVRVTISPPDPPQKFEQLTLF